MLFILAEFNDRAGSTTEASWATLISDHIADYYNVASHGQITLSPASESYGIADNGVVGWVNVGTDHPNTSASSANRILAENAVLAADPYVDFAAYDVNGDGYTDSEELAVVVVAAGYERAYSSAYSPSVWAHQWSIPGGVTVDGVLVGHSYWGNGGGYAQFGELHRSSAGNEHQATMGIMVHELGHLIFDLPDLYDIDGSSAGISIYGVMSYGTWGRAPGQTHPGESPVMPTAWTRYTLGWADCAAGVGSESIVAAGASTATGSNSCYRAPATGQEYFLVENRLLTGYDAGMARYIGNVTGGVAIWHIDDGQSGNSNDLHRLVDLEEADANIVTSETNLWFSGNATSFHAGTDPNSDFYGDIASGVHLDAISAQGETMDVTFHSGTNSPPTADAQSLNTPEDTALAITLSGSDADGDALTFAVVSGPSHGSLSGTAPNLTYTPAANYHGADSLSFTVSDGVATSAPATVSISVTAVNDPPVAHAQTLSTPEDTALAITLSGSDPDGDALAFNIVSGPSQGSLSGTAPNLTYTPAANYHGADSLSFTVSDGVATSAPATVSISVSAVNDPPVAHAQTLSTAENTVLAISLSGSDADGDALTFAIVSGPSQGSLSGTAPNLTYTPAANYHGADSLSFTVSDGVVTSTPATVSISVSAVNDPPVAHAQTLSTPEDTVLAISLSGSDADGDALTFAIVSGPSQGSLSGTAPNLTYTPAANYHGADSLSFTVSDGVATSAPATVSIEVTAVNDPPVAHGQSLSTPEDTALAISLSGSDADGDALTYAIFSGPSHGGSLSGTPPNLIYTPAADYHGADSFIFTVSDGVATSTPVTVSVAVAAVNDLPVAHAQTLSTPEDTALAISLSGSDADGDALTFAVVSGPSHGSLSGTAPNLTYTPAADYHGADSLSFTVSDGVATSAPATVSISVSAVNDPPVADAQTLGTPEDTALAITLSGSDADGDALTFNIVSGPSHGSLSGTAPNLTYTPAANYNGADSLSFTVSDAVATSAAAVVSISVSAVNQPPVADDKWVSTPEDTQVAISLSGSDPDGDALTFNIVSGPSHGTLSGTAPNLTYNPAAGYHGADSLTYRVSDGVATSAPATVSISVTSVNDPPVADAQTLSTPEDTALGITLSGSDPDGDALTFNIVSGPSHGSLSGSAPELTYTPAAGFTGADSLSFTVSDGVATSAPATVSISVEAGGSVTLYQSGFDSDEDGLLYLDDSFRASSAPDYASGAWDANGGYSDGGLRIDLGGIDNADIYGMSGGWELIFELQQTQEVLVQVRYRLSQAAEYESDEYSEMLLSLDGILQAPAGNDYVARIDGDGSGGGEQSTGWQLLQLNLGTLTAGSHQLVLGGYNNKKTYGNESTWIQIDDLSLSTISGQNQAPTADAQTLSTPQDTALAITLTGSDPEGDSLTYQVVEDPLNGTLSGSAPNLTYTPDAGFVGSDSLSFIADDGQLSSSEATISIQVEAAAGGLAEMIDPTPGSTLGGSSVVFQWSAASGAQQYWLYVGSNPGAYNYYSASQGTATSATLSGLPADGSTLYVRLWTRTASGWEYNDYQYQAASGGGTAGPAEMVAPAPGSTLAGSTVTFQWSAPSGAQQYWLYVGSNPGAYNYYSASQGTATSATLSGLPADGSTLYVRLWTHTASGWEYNDYQYQAASGGGTAGLAEMISPAPGSTLAGSTVTFQWSAPSGAQQYWLYVGSNPGAYNYYSASQGTATSATLSGLPADGSTLYVRLWTRTASGWEYNDYQYQAAG